MQDADQNKIFSSPKFNKRCPENIRVYFEKEFIQYSTHKNNSEIQLQSGKKGINRHFTPENMHIVNSTKITQIMRGMQITTSGNTTAHLSE